MKIFGNRIETIFASSESPYFTHKGCDNCCNGSGKVMDCTAILKYHNPTRLFQYYEIELCVDCFSAFYGVCELPENGNNVYGIGK